MHAASSHSDVNDQFLIEELVTGMYASGYGELGDGRSFAFHTHQRQLIVEVYQPNFRGPVPQHDDVVAVATRTVTGIDLTDARSLTAAVRDTVAAAKPVPRPALALLRPSHRR
jgi:hypothetical protein